MFHIPNYHFFLLSEHKALKIIIRICNCKVIHLRSYYATKVLTNQCHEKNQSPGSR